MEAAKKPGTGKGPIAVDGSWGATEGLGGFIDAQAGVEAKAHNVGRLGKFVGKVLDGFIESKDVGRVWESRKIKDIGGQAVHAATAFA